MVSLQLHSNTKLKIAPKSQILRDYENFKPILQEKNLNPQLKKALFALSVAGHSKKGHCEFTQAFPDTSPHDILAAICNNSLEIDRIRHIVSEKNLATNACLEELLDIYMDLKKPENSELYDPQSNSFSIRNPRNGEPIFGFSHADNLKIPNKKISLFCALQGAIKAAFMDSEKFRAETENYYKTTLDGKELVIGRGSCHVANKKKFRKANQSMEQYSEIETSQEKINELYSRRLLVPLSGPKQLNRLSPDLVNLYIRTKKGQGCCDDASLLTIGLSAKKFGIENAIVAFIMAGEIDKVDTFDKAGKPVKTGGTDEWIGENINEKYALKRDFVNSKIASKYLKKHIKYSVSPQELLKEIKGRYNFEISQNTVRNYIHKKTGAIIDLEGLDSRLFPEKLVKDEEIYEVIYMGSKSNTFQHEHSSSVRNFEVIQPANGRNMTTRMMLEKYLISEEIVPGMLLGFSRVPSEKFFDSYISRLDFARKQKRISF